LVVALLFMFARFENGQTVSAVSPEMHMFGSPMVLEVSPLAFQGDVFQVDLKNYSCRGVTIENFFMFTNFGRKTAAENRALELRASLFNSSAKDKQSVLRVDLIDGEKVVSSGALVIKISPDEKGIDHRSFPNPLNPADLAKAKIRITMTCPDR